MDRFICCVVAVFSACFCHVVSETFKVPDATFQFLNPRGVRMSIPGNDLSVKRVSFHVNVNQPFVSRENGQYSADITQTRDRLWSWVFPYLKVKQGDTIFFWIYVVTLNQNQRFNSYAHHGSIEITKPHPHEGSISYAGSPSSTSQTTTTSTGTPSSTSQTTTSSTGTRQPSDNENGVVHDHLSIFNKWSHQVTIGGTEPEDEFMVFVKRPYATWIQGGKLFIKPSLLADQYNETFLSTGELYFGHDCTSVNMEQCKKQANHYLILPPIVSARITSKNTFRFRYGIVEIRAKLPSGKWIVPELWLEPVNGPSTERVVMGLSRGNQDGFQFGWRTLEVGVVGDSQSSLGRKSQDTPWSQDFHTFKLFWTPSQMLFSVDNQIIHRVSSKRFAIVNKEVYITIGVHVAGTREFPDTISEKPWKNSDPKRFVKFWEARSGWYPTWSADSALQVEWIKITEHD